MEDVTEEWWRKLGYRYLKDEIYAHVNGSCIDFNGGANARHRTIYFLTVHSIAQSSLLTV